jgi:hypothetical protein
MLAGSRKEGRMAGASGPLDPLELALLLEATEDLSGSTARHTAGRRGSRGW